MKDILVVCDRCGETFDGSVRLKAGDMKIVVCTETGRYDSGTFTFLDICPECIKSLKEEWLYGTK